MFCRKTVYLKMEKIQYKALKTVFNPLSSNPEKWSNTFKQIVGKMPTICLSVFDHFMNLALKGLIAMNPLKILFYTAMKCLFIKNRYVI